MRPVWRFDWRTAEYAEAFATLVRCFGDRAQEKQLLRKLIADQPAESHAVDWGAGSGDFTCLLLERFRHVHAVEPHASMRALLAERCPRASIVDGTIMSVELPAQPRVALISHVFYHVPDYKWGAYTMHAAGQLAEDGILIVSLKAADSGCNRMLRDFGAPSYDLLEGLTRAIRLHPEFTLSFVHAPAAITTASFAETLAIARFMLCDRDADAFSRPPTEEAFQAYVRRHFWNAEQGTGGWDCPNIFCCVRRNPAYDSHA